jgi:DNA repair protein RadC
MIILKDCKLKVCDAPSVASLLQGWLNAQDEIERDKEHGIVIVLSVRQRLLLVEVVGVGILDALLLHPREVFRRAITVGGASVIVAHNHPGLECEPSGEDITCTERLRAAGTLIGIAVIDHIIFTPSEFYSFREHDLI